MTFRAGEKETSLWNDEDGFVFLPFFRSRVVLIFTASTMMLSPGVGLGHSSYPCARWLD